MVPRNALLFSSLPLFIRRPKTPRPPKGGTPTSDRLRFVYLPETCFDARPPSGLVPPAADLVLVPRRGLERKSTVCGLNGFLPSARADGSLHLNPQPRSALLLLRLFAPCSNVNSRFRFGKKNCALAHLSLQNGIQKIPGEKGKNKGKRPNRNGDGHLTKQLTLITHYYEHQSYHHQW
jgi:hypothetical protein